MRHTYCSRVTINYKLMLYSANTPALVQSQTQTQTWTQTRTTLQRKMFNQSDYKYKSLSTNINENIC